MYVQLGQILDKKVQKDQPPPTVGAKTVLGTKAGYCTCPLHTHHHRGQTPKPPLQSDPSLHISNQLTNIQPGNKQGKRTCFPSLLQPQEPQYNFVWISWQAFYQFLVTGEGQEHWLGSRLYWMNVSRMNLLSDKCSCNVVSVTTNRTWTYCTRNILCPFVLPSVQIRCVSVCNQKNLPLSFHLWQFPLPSPPPIKNGKNWSESLQEYWNWSPSWV